jgi:hypothetical protein
MVKEMRDNIEVPLKQAVCEDGTGSESCTVTGFGIETLSYVIVEFATSVAHFRQET